MSRLQPASERKRTEPPTRAELDAFLAHDQRTQAFTDGLREERCRGRGRFGERLGENVSVLRPLVGPWTLEILFLLYVEGPRRFGGLKRALEGVSSRVLTDKLRHLEREGHLERRDEGRAVVYALTPRGATVARHLHPIVFYLRNAEALCPGQDAPPTRA